MKKISFVILLLTGLSLFANAQSKSGHINTSELVALMAESDSARVTLAKYQTELTEELRTMEGEYQTKLNTYQQKQATWTATIREAKEAELQEIIQRLQQFNQSAQNELAQMQQTLMMPIYQKAQEAIEKVAKANNLVYVYDTAVGSLIYINEEQSLNLLPLAKKELGIPAEKVAPSQIAEEQQLQQTAQAQ
jgi:outer membrane protein